MAEPDLTTRRIALFLGDIGLAVRWDQIAEPTVLPGVKIDGGVLVVDAIRLQHPGDLLHEAGHLAVVPASERSQLTDNVGRDGGLEMSAIAWSYAALCHLALDPTVVFHEDGYLGGSASLIENFTAGRYIGVPVLQWLGLTADVQIAKERGIEPYPQMIKWALD